MGADLKIPPHVIDKILDRSSGVIRDVAALDAWDAAYSLAEPVKPTARGFALPSYTITGDTIANREQTLENRDNGAPNREIYLRVERLANRTIVRGSSAPRAWMALISARPSRSRRHSSKAPVGISDSSSFQLASKPGCAASNVAVVPYVCKPGSSPG